jgi:hypothetical protein
VTDEFAAIWRELLSADAPDGVSIRRVRPDFVVATYLGIENPGRTYVLVFEIPASAIPRAVRWPDSSGLTIETTPVPSSPQLKRILVKLADAASRDIFATLAADVLQMLDGISTPRRAVETIAARLVQWQLFLSRHGAGGLSPEAQHGLFAELIVLRDLVISALGPLAALNGWTGPVGADQDFQLPDVTIEVKASVANPAHTVKISNVRQLDDSSAVALHLVHVALQARNDQGTTLPGLVDQLRTIVGPSIAALNERLNHAGYLDIHQQKYASVGYEVMGLQVYRVEDDFPRIRESELRAGIGDVTYHIAVSSCARFQVALEDLRLLVVGTE